MEGPEILIPLTLFGGMAWVLYAFISGRHKERMSIIEKGLVKEDLKYLYTRRFLFSPNPLSSLKWGVILVSIGTGLIIAMFLRGVLGVEEGIYPIMLCLSGGAGLIGFYFIAKKKDLSSASEN